MSENETCGRLLSLAGHELRTPISIVAGYLRMLAQGIPEPLTDRQRKLVDEALKSCARLTALAGEISELAQLEDGTLRLGREPVALFPLVAAAAREVAQPADVELRVEVLGDEAGADVAGDAARLRDAFTAIITACARESGLQPELAVLRAVRPVAARRAAFVAIGAPEVVNDHARQDPARLAPFDAWQGGLGLRLLIAARIIERHGGQLLAPGGQKGSALVVIPLEARDGE